MIAALAATAGCGTAIDGTPEPEPAAYYGNEPTAASSADSPAAVPSRLPSELVLPPERFPEPYVAVVLPAQAVAQAAPDLTGIPTGAKVEPPGCLPDPQDYGPTGTAMTVGTDNDSRATISVEVVASTGDLSGYRAYAVECGEVQATHRGVTATVTTELEPDPPAPGDGVRTLALSRTVRSGGTGDTVTQSMTTRVAQIDDVRVFVTYMSFGSGAPDVTNLDRVYRDAVQYVVGR
ncbi:DUF5642 family protein [Rhodococcus chondri]|uniref:DUF5642 family protein n=1 Tax=Rhodococcus chondri TaxID=3065941 RepID=UPI0038B68C3A